jgi:predicted dehydrogenase
MMAPISVAVVGDGPISQQLRDHGVPLGRVRLAAANGFSASQAVLVDLPADARAVAVAAALRAGKIVLCPPPVALAEAELAAIAEASRAGGGRLLPAGEIAHCEAGRHGFAAVHAPEFGALRSLYVAIRQPQGAGGDVIDELLPEALDAVLALVPDPFDAVRMNATSLFGAARDTAVILLRGGGDVVVTMELSRCLPPTLPATGLGEVEIDVIGAARAVRIVPQASAVRLFRDDRLAAIPWVDPPVLAMLRAIETAVDTPETSLCGLARATRAMAVTASIRAAL